ncbi:MAG: type II secretion system protein GspG [Kiritimatiellia bacterium]|jgi:hypothetical protein
MQKRTYWYWGGTLGTLIIIGCALIVLQGDTITPKDRTIGNLGRIEFLLVEFVDAFSHFPDTLTELTNSLTSSFQLDDGWGHPICYIKTNDIVILRSYGKDGLPGGSGDNADIDLHCRIRLGPTLEEIK